MVVGFFSGLGCFLLLLWVVTGLGFVPVVITIIIVLQCDVSFFLHIQENSSDYCDVT